jgi:hypothetical protein
LLQGRGRLPVALGQFVEIGRQFELDVFQPGLGLDEGLAGGVFGQFESLRMALAERRQLAVEALDAGG